MCKKPSNRLPKKKVAQLLKELDGTKLPEHPNNLGAFFTVYQLKDGKVLDVDNFDGTAIMYDSYEHMVTCWQRIQEKVEAKRGNEHVLAENFPYQDNFLNEIPNLVDQLAKYFVIPREELDNSIKSLEKIDQGIKKIGARKCLKLPIFPMLIAYVGEVLRCQQGAKWKIRHVPLRSIAVWEPFLVDAKGNEYLPWGIIYKELYEEFPYSLQGTVAAYAGSSPSSNSEKTTPLLRGSLNKIIKKTEQ